MSKSQDVLAKEALVTGHGGSNPLDVTSTVLVLPVRAGGRALWRAPAPLMQFRPGRPHGR